MKMCTLELDVLLFCPWPCIIDIITRLSYLLYVESSLDNGLHNQCGVISRKGNLIFIIFLFLFIIKEKKNSPKKGEIENEITIGRLILN